MPWTDTGAVSLFHTDAGNGPPVLLLHELGGSSASWHAVGALLMPHRRVIAVDLAGAGLSEKPVGALPVRRHADDLAALLNALGIARIDVLGSALGSVVGALLAGRHPDRVRRLMVCAVAKDMAGTTATYLEQRAAKVRAEGMRAVADTSLANAFPDSHAAARAAYRPIYLANDPAAYAELSIGLARADLTDADWRAVRAPTLVCSGAHDFIWPPESGRQVAAAIPDARFQVLTDAGHFPHLQTPEDLARIALDFLGAG